MILSMFSLLLISCSSNKTMSLLDLKEYKSLDMDKIVSVNVEWDINENEPIKYSINNDENVQYIIDELSRKDEFKSKKEKYDGGHSRIYLVDDSNNKTLVHLSCVYDGDIPYYYTNQDLYNYIYNYGKNLGVLQ